MSIFGPRQTGSDTEPETDHEQEDAPLPTRFGRHGRRGLRPRQERGAAEDPNAAPDGEDPFEDDGGL